VRRSGRIARLAAVLGLVLTLTTRAHAAAGSQTSAASPAVAGPAPCTLARSKPSPKPTTITTLQQAYECIFAHYYGGPLLDDRTLLAGAFSAFTQELEGRGLDQLNATLPALTGNRQGDWNAFAKTYQAVLAALPDDAKLRQALAAATMNGIVASLNDNHASWTGPLISSGSTPRGTYGLGFETSPESGLVRRRPQAALPPLFVAQLDPDGPAAKQGVRLGDIIEAVNGAPPFPDGVIAVGVMNWLHPQFPQDDPVQLTLYRPATGRTWTLSLRPVFYRSTGSAVTAKVLHGDVAYVRLPEFAPGAANAVLRAIASPRRGTSLRAVILDLRLNPGGYPPEVSRLLGAFVHGNPWEYDCDVSAHCSDQRTDDSVPLLHLKLVVLTDRNCASACDAFSGAVKDLHLGTLVGDRTAGSVSGPARAYVLDDSSLLLLPALHALGADREIINGIGVAADYYMPLTAKDLSEGRDPALAKALALLGA
jgi:carboxyl-terminal processing protease